jgi:hypothetical protein
VIVSFNFTGIEIRTQNVLVKEVKLPECLLSAYAVYFNVEAIESALVFLNSREYSAFQLLLKLRAQVRESLQVLNLNTGHISRSCWRHSRSKL